MFRQSNGTQKELERNLFLISFFFQVQERNGKSWFWLGGEVFMPTHQNLNPFSFSSFGGWKDSLVVNLKKKGTKLYYIKTKCVLLPRF